jgi:hypothetical protein
VKAKTVNGSAGVGRCGGSLPLHPRAHPRAEDMKATCGVMGFAHTPTCPSSLSAQP